MEWFSAVLNSTCAFCQMPTGKTPMLCQSCAKWATALETASPHLQTILGEFGGLEVLSLGAYEGWLKDVILNHKQNPHPFVARWLAKRIHSLMQELLPNSHLIWVPGNYLAPLHLIDGIVAALEETSTHVEQHIRLSRKLWHTSKNQKLRSKQERKKLVEKPSFNLHYRKANSQTNKTTTVLFDDVVTTGSTLLGCKILIENKTGKGVEIPLGLTLAYTPFLH